MGSIGNRADVKAARAASVPVFTLYGEVETAADVEFLHIEPIRARGESLGWEIDRHTHRGLFQAVFLFDKPARAVLDNQVAQVEAPCAILVPSRVVHAFNFQPGTDGYVLTMAAGWAAGWAAGQAAGAAAGAAAGWGEAKSTQRASGLFAGLMEESAVLSLGDDAASCKALLDLLYHETRDRRAGYGYSSEWLSACVLMMLSRRRMAGGEAIRSDDPRSQIFARFRALVEDHYVEHWPVSRYAQALATSESRLDRICRTLAGHSAFEVVQTRVLLEARRRLVHVGAPVTALAYELGFEDPAYFCRFFKRHTGATPTQWRRVQRERLAGGAQA